MWAGLEPRDDENNSLLVAHIGCKLDEAGLLIELCDLQNLATQLLKHGAIERKSLQKPMKTRKVAKRSDTGPQVVHEDTAS